MPRTLSISSSKSSVLLVGAGQLGSRYLQGLAAIDQPLQITVVDPSIASLSIARDRFNQVQRSFPDEVNFTTSFEDIPNHLDLAMVVTPAHCRARVVVDLASRHQVSAWILEKLLAQSSDQIDQIEHALVGNSHVWVNTSRRLIEWHQTLYAEILPNGPVPLRVRVVGGSWGLACNAIHFIDLVAWWSQASVQSVDSSGLEQWVQSKRAGFQEVIGSLRVSYTNGSQLELFCGAGTEPTQITVATSNGEWVIDESAGRATSPHGQEFLGHLSYQSELTAPLVKKILQNGCCDLPTLAESMAQHRLLLNSLLMHWNQNQRRQDSIISIT